MLLQTGQLLFYLCSSFGKFCFINNYWKFVNSAPSGIQWGNLKANPRGGVEWRGGILVYSLVLHYFLTRGGGGGG